MKSKTTTTVFIMFILGIFMGAIDSGIVSPAREIIENSFDVGRNSGIWMITLYTLCYAIAMPIVSKMADRKGHKKVFVFSVAFFGLGSLLCGLTNFYGNFTLFLLARVIQAVGAGGIMPIATTVIGLGFPEEKRGFALGMVGAIFGVATIIGPSLGSGILGLAGNNGWGWIFFINVPISLLIIFLSTRMENTFIEENKPMDLAGAITIAAVIATLLYGLTNLDFFHLSKSIQDPRVFPYLLAFILLIPALVMVENKAVDPVLNMKYFKSKQMILVFIVAFITGIGMMGTVFVPQFAENVLRIKVGSGGYLITLLAVFSGISAPLSGGLTDKKGAPLVLEIGFAFIVMGSLFLGYVATSTLSLSSVMIGLALVGFGIGFTMGAPLNYLVLNSVPENEGTTAIATMSLIRSIGVTISPGIMIGFIVQASKNLPPRLTELLQQSMNTATPGMGMPPMLGGNGDISNAFSNLQTADVTSIVDRLENGIQYAVPEQVFPMVMQGIESMRSSIENLFQSTLNVGYTNMFTASAIIAAVGFIITALLRRFMRTTKPNHRPV